MELTEEWMAEKWVAQLVEWPADWEGRAADEVAREAQAMGVTAVVPRKIACSNGSHHTPKPMIRMPRLQAASPGDSMRPCSHRTQGSCPLRHTVPSSLGRRSSAPEAMAKAKGATADPGRVVLMVRSSWYYDDCIIIVSSRLHGESIMMI